jgi:hypothetical protein
VLVPVGVSDPPELSKVSVVSLTVTALASARLPELSRAPLPSMLIAVLPKAVSLPTVRFPALLSAPLLLKVLLPKRVAELQESDTVSARVLVGSR